MCGGQGCFVQMEHQSTPTPCPPPNLALHYPKLASTFFLSQRCDHITKALHLNCEIHSCCFSEGVCLLALFLFTLVFVFSSYKVQQSSSLLWSSYSQGVKSPFHVDLLVFNLHPFSSHQFSCFQLVTHLLFALIFMFSNCNCSPFCINFHDFNYTHPPLHVFKSQLSSECSSCSQATSSSSLHQSSCCSCYQPSSSSQFGKDEPKLPRPNISFDKNEQCFH